MLVGIRCERDQRFDFADGFDAGAHARSVALAPPFGDEGDLDGIEQGKLKQVADQAVALLPTLPDQDILNYIIEGNKREQIVLERLKILNAQEFKTSLFSEDKNSTITRPDSGQ